MTKEQKVDVEKDEKKSEAEKKKRLEREQQARRLDELLVTAEAAVSGLQLAEADARARLKALRALVSHTAGFYNEIDKLAKGKALFAATDLAVEQANDIIRDAKAIVEADPHLARVKEFVPAGDNPVYPDILLKTRTIQQCLVRCTTDIENEEKRAVKALLEGKTIAVGLRLWKDTGKQPTKEDVHQALGSRPFEGWFFATDAGTYLMDVVRLMKEGLPAPTVSE